MLKQRLSGGLARMKSTLWVLVLATAIFVMGSAPVYAQQTTDFLKAEGAPVSVAKYLENGLRKAMSKKQQYKLLPNPMAPGMAQLTLGCTLDSAACVARLAKMRSAKVVFHLRVLPFGSRAKAVFRKLDGTTGKTLKSVSYRFRRRQLKTALATLSAKMFGGAAPVARPIPVARRAAPPVRVAPVARRAVVAVRRAAPPVRRAVAVVARRAAPVARRAVAAVKRVVPPVARRVAPVVPPVRRVVVARRAAPPAARITATPTPRRVAAIKPSLRVEPRPPASLGTPRMPTRRVAAAGTKKPQPAPTVPVWKRPSLWAWICVGVAVAAVGGTIALGLDAQSKEGEIKQLIERSKQGEQISYKQNVQPLEESGKSSAVGANIFIGIGAVAAAGAVVLFLLPKPKPAPPKTSRAITPRAPVAFSDFSLQIK